MLSHLRHTAREWSTRLLPHRIRLLSTEGSTSQSSSHSGELGNAISPPPSVRDSHSQSLPPPAQYPVTPSQQSFEAYAFPSAAEEIQPILDIPPESDPLLAYLTSRLMRHGKRHAAARKTSRMLLHLYALTRTPPLPIFREAVLLAAPSIRIISHKTGGKNVQKPVPLGEKQRTRFAIKWMIAAAERRKGRPCDETLARIVLEIIKGKSEEHEVLKKKLEFHKLGMVNRGNVRARP